ncbi:hypothetical protein [Lacrimispora sp.]|uniref:hypothetical protein n=1 Tax=Lacrimispora sp. TaxID=2719234 RepID=UPI0039932B76
MNKKKCNKAAEIIVKILVVIAIINGVIVGGSIIFFIVLFLKGFSTTPKVTEEEVKLEQEQRLEVVKRHLEKKYEKKFVINSDGTDGGGSPIPFSSGYYTVTYEAYAEDDPNFRFIVDVVPVSIKNNEIKEIRDSYCWKFLKEKLNNEIKETLNGDFDGDYKLILYLSSSATFENNIKPDSSIKDYFNGNGKSPAIYIDMFTTQKAKKLEIKTEQKISQLLDKIKEQSDHVDITFSYYVMKKNEDFYAIDITREHLRLYDNDIYRTYRAVGDMDKELKFQLMIDTGDK